MNSQAEELKKCWASMQESIGLRDVKAFRILDVTAAVRAICDEIEDSAPLSELAGVEEERLILQGEVKELETLLADAETRAEKHAARIEDLLGKIATLQDELSDARGSLLEAEHKLEDVKEEMAEVLRYSKGGNCGSC